MSEAEAIPTGAVRAGVGGDPTADGGRAATERGHRLLEQAEGLLAAGSAGEAATLASEVLAWAPDPVRARALPVLAAATFAGADPTPDHRELLACAEHVAGDAGGSANEALLYLCAAGLRSGNWSDARRAAAGAAATVPAGDERLRALTDLAQATVAIASGDVTAGRARMPAPDLLLRVTDAGRDGALTATLAAGCLIWSADHEAARYLLDEIERRVRAAGATGALPAVLCSVGNLEQRLCRWEAAGRAGAEALELARELGQHRSAALAGALVAIVDAVQGRGPECRSRSLELLGSAGDMPFVRSVALAALGLLELGEGRYHQAAHWFEVLAGSEQARGRPQPGVVMWHADLADAYIGMGRPDRARAVLEGLDGHARAAGSQRAGAAVIRGRAVLAADDGEADGLFAEALTLYRGPAWRFARARTQLAWGQRMLERHRPDAAAAALRAALEEFEAQGARGWVARAAALLKQTGGPAEDPPGLGSLTADEMKVAMAAALGSGVEDIAAGLFMDPAAADRALASALAKLGVAGPAGLGPLMGNLARAGAVPAPRSPAAPPARPGVPAATGEPVRVRMLGGFEIHHPGREADLPDGITARAVKAVVLARKIPVETLIEELWPDAEPGLGRTRLRSLMARLRRGCPPVIARQGPAMVVAEGVVVDVEEFEQLAHRVQLAAAAGEPDVGALAEQAIALYRGDLLPTDLYLDFTVAPRERLKRRYLAVLDVAIDHACAQGSVESAVRHIESGLTAEPYDEAMYLRAAQILAGAGRRSEALTFLRRAEHALRELGLPATATAAFKARLTGP